MSADAKIWQDDNDDWKGICDMLPNEVLLESPYGLSQLISEIEQSENKGHPMRWEFKVYPDGKVGLRGFCS